MPFALDQFSLLIILGIVAIIIEIIIGAADGFELLVLGIIFILGGLIGMASGSLPIAIAAMVILTLGYIFFARRMIKKSLHITTQKTNVESIIGKTANTVEPITPDEPGQIKIEGEIWRAESDHEIAKGQKVMIKSVSGVTVKVTEM